MNYEDYSLPNRWISGVYHIGKKRLGIMQVLRCKRCGAHPKIEAYETFPGWVCMMGCHDFRPVKSEIMGTKGGAMQLAASIWNIWQCEWREAHGDKT